MGVRRLHAVGVALQLPGSAPALASSARRPRGGQAAAERPAGPAQLGAGRAAPGPERCSGGCRSPAAAGAPRPPEHGGCRAGGFEPARRGAGGHRSAVAIPPPSPGRPRSLQPEGPRPPLPERPPHITGTILPARGSAGPVPVGPTPGRGATGPARGGTGAALQGGGPGPPARCPGPRRPQRREQPTLAAGLREGRQQPPARRRRSEQRQNMVAFPRMGWG